MRIILLSFVVTAISVGTQPAAAQFDARRIFTVSTKGAGSVRDVTIVGDVNGDGLADWLVSLSTLNQGLGVAYVLSGRNGSLLRSFLGAAPADNFGAALSRAGDVDLDGVPDVVIGAPDANGKRGQAQVYSGRTGALIWVVAGPSPNDVVGRSVGDAGDVNGDGHADIIAGGRGIALVVSGKDGKTLHTFRGAAADQFGFAVDGVGDADLDGHADLAVSAPDTGSITNQGVGLVQILSGKTGWVIRTIQGTGNGFFGYDVSGGADIDRDTIPDVVVGSRTGNRVDAFSGRDGKRIWTFPGPFGGAVGVTCAMAGDVDGDGHEDVIAGEHLTLFTGISRVVSGRTGQELFSVQGSTVGRGGDVNGDGYADVVTGIWIGTIWVSSGKELSLRTDRHEVSALAGGTQNMALEAGAAHANRSYWIFGSVTGTKPGVRLAGIDIPLIPDFYTDFLMVNPNAPNLVGFRGTLSATGSATAAIQIPAAVSGAFTLHHAFIVYTGGSIHMASNASTLWVK